MSEFCTHYVGVACVDGTCAVSGDGNCRYCIFYKGCVDCAFAGTEYCDNQEGLQDEKDKL